MFGRQTIDIQEKGAPIKIWALTAELAHNMSAVNL